MEYSYELKIPKERIGVLIGVGAKIKRQIEEATHTRLEIDSKEGDVRILGEDSLGMLTAQEIVKAIGRGFNPDIAMNLSKQDIALEIISLQDYLGKSKNRTLQLKGRIIGQEGSTRRVIEELTGTYICVYGKTVSIIGEIENVQAARSAIERLLAGSPHASVYRWLERKGAELRKRSHEMRLVREAAESTLFKENPESMHTSQRKKKTKGIRRLHTAKNI